MAKRKIDVEKIAKAVSGAVSSVLSKMELDEENRSSGEEFRDARPPPPSPKRHKSNKRTT